MYNSRNKDKVRQYQWYMRGKNPDSYFKMPANKKKIRNWPTLIKRLATLKEEHLFHSLDHMKSSLEDSHSFYMKLYVDPFYRLEKRNPPLWFRKLFIQALCDVYDNWQQYAQQLGIPYYLKIWIFEPNFTQSQIAFGIDERITWYENLFTAHDQNVTFPHEKYSFKPDDCTHALRWEFAKDLDVVEKEDFANRHWNKLIKENKIWPTAQYKEVEPELELYMFYVGDLWIGDKSTPPIGN